MDEWTKKLIHLDHCRGLGWMGLYRILKQDPSLDQIYSRTAHFWKESLRLPPSKLSLFIKDLHNKNLKKIFSLYEKNQIQCLTFLDSNYPPALTFIYQQPWILYCKGDIHLLKDPRILAVIGTRTPTDYGIKMVKYLIPDLVKENVSIVSGLAKGIDSFSQRLALQNGGNVIAVIGGGLFHIYPKENLQLAQQIMKKGVVLSEYPPVMKPEPWHFPMRNRIISGLARAILVVEGKQKSGTFITIQYGLDQGKDIYAVPGSVFSEQSAGPNTLIREGAKLIHNANDILQEWL